MADMKWSNTEKEIARKAFDAAYGVPQLDLFAWDRMRTSQGFSALGRLDF